MTKQECELMRDEMNLALAKIAQKYDVSMKVGNITYDELGFTAKVEAKHNSVNGMSIEEAEFRNYCYQFGFSPAEYKMCVCYDGVEYALVGFFPKGRKYTCKLRTLDGKEMKATTDFVRRFTVSMDI